MSSGIKHKLVEAARRVTRVFGVDLVKYGPNVVPGDFDEETAALVRRLRPYTLTSPERLFAVSSAIQYLVAQRIPGDIVECGVWKGGSMMAAALTLLKQNDASRHLYLFDTFEGMTAPVQHDVDFQGSSAADQMKKAKKDDAASIWAAVPLDEVKRNLASTGYDPQKVHFIKGKVEDTLPGQAPPGIAMLRLDTDWYESTRHELEHLFPRIVPGGILIIDDYGHWQGARKAVDEYFQEHRVPVFLSRIDFTGRIGVVPRR
jgi:O-methyltransferase